MLYAARKHLCFQLVVVMHRSLSIPTSWQDGSRPAVEPRASGAPKHVPRGRPSRLEQLGYAKTEKTVMPVRKQEVNESHELSLERHFLREQAAVLSHIHCVTQAEQVVLQRWHEANKRETHELNDYRDVLEERELGLAVREADCSLKASENELAELLSAREKLESAEMRTVLMVREGVTSAEPSLEPPSTCPEETVDGRPRWAKRRKCGTKGKKAAAALIDKWLYAE